MEYEEQVACGASHSVSGAKEKENKKASPIHEDKWSHCSGGSVEYLRTVQLV